MAVVVEIVEEVDMEEVVVVVDVEPSRTNSELEANSKAKVMTTNSRP